MLRRTCVFVFAFLLTVSCSADADRTGTTEITPWPEDKSGAVSVTFDDSTINQFRVALPLLEDRGMPGTFYIITGAVPGSANEGEFIGRPVEEIIAETAEIPTTEENLYERASAIRYLGYEDVHEYHTRAGQLYEGGDVERAIAAIDEGYERVRNGEFVRSDGIEEYLYDVLYVEPDVELITWEELRSFDETSHEFGSHSVTHPYLAVMDEANIRYELERSKEEIRNQLGPEYTFSAEAPFGTTNERVMEHLYEAYPTSRNRMPEPWLEEIHRGDEREPAASNRDYVQWQRGPLTDTPLDLMKSWVDTTAEHDNIWLVLVFHGVEGIGWEPKSEEELREYFDYIKEYEDDLWIATFADGAKYVQQRMNAAVSSEFDEGVVTVTLTHPLAEEYNLPLTLKTYIPIDWEGVTVQQGERVEEVQVIEGDRGSYVLYQARPNAEAVKIAAL